MPKRCMIPPRSFIFLPRRVRPDTKSPRLRIDGPWTVSVKRYARKDPHQPWNVYAMRNVAPVGKIIETGGTAAGPLDQFEQRWNLHPIAVEAHQKITDESAEPLLRYHPEVIAVVNHLPAFWVVRRRPRDAVLDRIGAGHDCGRGCRRNRRKDRYRRLVHASGIRDTFEMPQLPGLNRGTHDARGGRVDDDQENFHISNCRISEGAGQRRGLSDSGALPLCFCFATLQTESG